VNEVLEFWNQQSLLLQVISIIVTSISFILAGYLTLLRIQKTRIEIKEKKTNIDITSISIDSYNSSLELEPSNYNLCHSSTKEFYRLKYQSKRIKEFELRHLNDIHKLLKIEKPNVVDIGCADGISTIDRFSNPKKWGNILGIDNQLSLINEAKQNINQKNFTFTTLDIIELCNKNVNLKDYTQAPIQLIYATLTIHHLGKQNQLRVLKYLWNQLDDNGILYIRSFDDDLKLTSSKYTALIDELIMLSATIPGASDRYHGRDLFQQLFSLTNSNKDIKMDYFITDTTQMNKEEKELFFQYAYGFRLERIKTTCNTNQTNTSFAETYKRAEEIINVIKNAFVHNDDFYSLSTECIAYAKKNVK